MTSKKQNKQLSAFFQWCLNCQKQHTTYLLFPSEVPMQTLWQDLRFALRQVWKNPGFSLTAILSLALGIGATVSVFSVLYGAVLILGLTLDSTAYARSTQSAKPETNGTRHHRPPGSPAAPDAFRGRNGSDG